jgi:ketosteroid isomerase-like protein
MKSNDAIARHDVDALQSFLDEDFVITISTGAIEHGTWVGSRTSENGKLENGGQYTAAWRKTDGVWRIYSELFVGLFCSGADG